MRLHRFTYTGIRWDHAGPALLLAAFWVIVLRTVFA